MSSIEVGEYVRTRAGHIRKVTRYMPYYENDLLMSDSCLFELDNKTEAHYKSSYLDEIVTKHSKNIIDLIEVGDIVNGEYKVDEFRKIGGEKTILCNTYNLDDSVIILLNKNIKTILTHEQYSQNAYRLEE